MMIGSLLRQGYSWSRSSPRMTVSSVNMLFMVKYELEVGCGLPFFFPLSDGGFLSCPCRSWKLY